MQDIAVQVANHEDVAITDKVAWIACLMSHVMLMLEFLMSCDDHVMMFVCLPLVFVMYVIV